MPFRHLKNVATLEYDPAKCTGCGMCVVVCPHAAFVMDGKKARLVDKNLCMECGACLRNCPFGAIAVEPGVGCAYAILLSKLKGREITCGD